MPFGLKNAESTYQRLVNRMFADLLGKTMKVYIDDMLVKSEREQDHISHLEQAFAVLGRYGMKLNPEKCSFGVNAGKFLGFMVTQRGIEVSPEQVQSILSLRSPQTKKEVQRLTGKLAALSRFISRSTDRCQPFFNALRKNKTFKWTKDYEAAFKGIKEYLVSSPFTG